MGCAQRAVLEFDEEVRVPWRPRLVPEIRDEAATVVRAPRPQRPARANPSRVGVCRPPAEARPLRRTATESAALLARPDHAASRPAPAGHSRPDRRRTGRLRLTRRARRLAAALILAAGVALGSLLGQLAGGNGDLRLAGETSVVVESGDTLWSIASSLGRDADVRSVVDQIQALNGLTSVNLVPGQTLRLP